MLRLAVLGVLLVGCGAPFAASGSQGAGVGGGDAGNARDGAEDANAGQATPDGEVNQCPSPSAWGCQVQTTGDALVATCCGPLDFDSGRCSVPSRCGAPVELPDFDGKACVEGCELVDADLTTPRCCSASDFEDGTCLPYGVAC
jgi:hypothetical protein